MQCYFEHRVFAVKFMRWKFSVMKEYAFLFACMGLSLMNLLSAHNFFLLTLEKTSTFSEGPRDSDEDPRLGMDVPG